MNLNTSFVEIDTLMVSLEHASGMGNYFMRDSVITFVDAKTCVFYDIDLNGNIMGSYFRRGNGKNEIPSVKGKIDFPQIGFEKGTTERGFQR